MLKIGLSACFLHADPQRAIFKGKTLQYAEQSIVHWVMSRDALAVVIPSPEGNTRRGNVTLADYARELDGLVLQGGSDVCPATYGEAPLRPEWNGDRVRDVYELALMRAFMDAGKPVLGICRGAQLINVAFGGTLYQDIGTQRDGALVHRNWDIYDQNFHTVCIEPDGGLAQLYGPGTRFTVNSVHHQAIKDVGQGLVVEARAEPDGIVEAVRNAGEAWVFGVQWHPEFHEPGKTGFVDDSLILQQFLERAGAPSRH